MANCDKDKFTSGLSQILCNVFLPDIKFITACHKPPDEYF